MATQRAIGEFTDARPGAEDLTGLEMRLIKRNSAGNFLICGEQEDVAGVLSEGKAAGAWSSINTFGQLKVIAGGAINAGDKVCSNSSGKAVVGATGTFGVARTTVSYEGQIVTVDFDRR